MNLDKAIKSVLLVNAKPLTSKEITNIIIKKHLVANTNDLSDRVNDYLTEANPKQFVKLGVQTYLYIPSRDIINQLRSSIMSISPNKKLMKALDSINIKKMILRDLYMFTDARIRFVLFLKFKSKYFKTKTFESLMNMGLKDSNVKVKALSLIYLKDSDWSFYYQIIELINDKFLYKYAIKHFYRIFHYDNSKMHQKKVASLLLNQNPQIVFEVYDLLFINSHISITPVLFYILENWKIYEKSLLKFKMTKEKIIDQIEKYPDNSDAINKNSMIGYCNSPNLEIKLLAVKFMHKKWKWIVNIDRIRKRNSQTNSQIRYYILKSYHVFYNKNKHILYDNYFLYHTIDETIIYAKKCLSDNDTALKNYAVQCLGDVGNDEELKTLQEIAKSNYAKDNYGEDVLLIAIGNLRIRLGK